MGREGRKGNVMGDTAEKKKRETDSHAERHGPSDGDSAFVEDGHQGVITDRDFGA